MKTKRNIAVALVLAFALMLGGNALLTGASPGAADGRHGGVPVQSANIAESALGDTLFWGRIFEGSTATMTVRKTACGTNDRLAGAEFVLYYRSGGERLYYQNTGSGVQFTADPDDATVIVTDTNGEAVIEDLPLRTYYLEETKAPDGYKIKRATTVVELGRDEVVLVENTADPDGGGTPTPGDETANIRVEKTDSETGEAVSGAKFLVYYMDNGVPQYYRNVSGRADFTPNRSSAQVFTTTAGAFTVYNLPYRTYYLEEVEAPTGYVIDSERTIVELGRDETVQITNTPIPTPPVDGDGALEITKADHHNREKLLDGAAFTMSTEYEGVTFYRTCQGGVYGWTADPALAGEFVTESGKTNFGALPFGTYVITEVRAPENYILEEDNSFTVNVNGSSSVLVTNTLEVPPDTGNPARLIAGLLALISLSAGVVLFVWKRFKK